MKEKRDSSQHLIKQAEINELFSQITSQEVEQFYKTYQTWSKYQQIARIQKELGLLREKQTQNSRRMQEATPSAVALATLAQLRASGVEDVELLDRMLERGEEWLDHTMQLLERCEELNVIRGNYTQWCEHALEGAYEWMGSMDDASLHDYFHAEAAAEDITPQALLDLNSTAVVTEDQLLRKLMSEEGSSTKRNTVPLPRITQKLPPLSVSEDDDNDAESYAFPVEIEETEPEPIDVEELARAMAEQQAYPEATQSEQQQEHIEDLFPVEIDEPIETDEPIEIDEPIETDEPVISTESLREAEQTELDAPPTSEDSEPDADSKVDAATSPDVETEAAQDEEDILLSLEPPQTNPEEEALPGPAVDMVTETGETEDTTSSPEQVKKKPHDEAPQRSVKKKPGFFRRLLARIFR